MVSFIILNWNNPELTINSIKNLEKHEYNLMNSAIIIVVDNNSEKSKREYLIEYFLKINGTIIGEEEAKNETLTSLTNVNKKVLILNKENYGYAKGNNIGLKFARKLGYKYAVIMNNDVELRESTTDKLLNIMRNSEKIAVLGPNIIGPDGKPQGPFKRSGIYSEFVFPLLFPILYIPEKLSNKAFYNSLLRKSAETGYVYVYRVMGCFMLVDLEIMEKVGWFDENTFLYAEEPILSEKLERAGYKTAFVPYVTVFHHHETSTKSFFGKQRWLIQLNSDLYYYKNYRYFNSFELFLVKFGRLYRIYILRKIKLFFKQFLSIFLKEK